MVNITELTCRVCLAERDVLINVYDELEDLNTSLSDLLYTCANLQINENDSFPKYLCEDCTRELLITSEFLKKCDKSKEILNEFSQNSKLIEYDFFSNPNDLIEYCTDDTNDIEVDDMITQDPDVDTEKDAAKLPNERTHWTEYIQSYSLRENIEPINPMELHKQLEYENIIEEDTLSDDCPNHFNSNEEESVGSEVQSLRHSTSKTIKTDAKFKKTGTFKCDICGAIFKQAFNLQKHMQKSHDFINCYTCIKCDHFFSLETEFHKHVKECSFLETKIKLSAEEQKSKAEEVSDKTAESEGNRKCQYCGREFATPFALRMHLRTHTGERPFPCTFCTKSFKTQSQLNVHHKRHTGQADFVCKICNKSFYEQSNLIVHMRSHTGERPHICTVCNKTFNRVFLLEFHMRTHTGEKPFKCNNCDKSFRQHTDLRNHLTIHTGQKPHICTLCEKSYIKRSHLLKHMRKHQIYPNSTKASASDEFKDDLGDLDTAVNNIPKRDVAYSDKYF